jgi:hypothetical protein
MTRARVGIIVRETRLRTLEDQDPNVWPCTTHPGGILDAGHQNEPNTDKDGGPDHHQGCRAKSYGMWEVEDHVYGRALMSVRGLTADGISTQRLEFYLDTNSSVSPKLIGPRLFILM